ncbi:MAG: DUF1353 domain-containing protein [Pseudomonadota bacterium]
MKAATDLPSRFYTSLQVRRASDGQAGQWELVAALIYYSKLLDKMIVVPAGFHTDLASVPRLPLAYWLFGSVADEAGVIHDYLYTSFVKGVTRAQADAVFAEASAVLKVAAWRRGPMWLGVRLFGGSHWGSGSPLSSVDSVGEGDAG